MLTNPVYYFRSNFEQLFCCLDIFTLCYRYLSISKDQSAFGKWLHTVIRNDGRTEKVVGNDEPQKESQKYYTAGGDYVSRPNNVKILE